MLWYADAGRQIREREREREREKAKTDRCGRENGSLARWLATIRSWLSHLAESQKEGRACVYAQGVIIQELATVF